MKIKLTSFFVLFFGLTLLLGGGAKSDKVSDVDSMVANEILVKYRGINDIRVIKLNEADNFDKTLSDLNNSQEVEYAEPNYLYTASIIPSDTYYGNQWYLEKIKAPQAWDVVREANGVIIAILDSGVQIGHPDLRNNIWRNDKEIPENNIDDDKNGFIDDINGWDFVNNTANPSPKFKDGFTEAGILHGTIVAGIAAAAGNNAAGIAGIAWRAKIMPLKVLDDAGEGNTSNVVKAIDYAVNNGADIINLSFVGFGFSQSLDSAVKRAYDAGVIVVAAAGNEQGQASGYSLDATPMYPACHDGGENRVIGVAATDTIDQKANFSSYGFKCVDIAAPGISIFSTAVYEPGKQINGKFFDKYYDGYWSGTSMATPMVSATIALMEEINPSLARDNLLKILLDNTDNINRLNPNYLNQLGRGRLNTYYAVLNAKNELFDKTVKVLLAPYSNYISKVKITDSGGKAGQEFNAYSDSFIGGVNVASGDVDGDGAAEIITGAGPGGGPHVRIFTQKGELKGQFFAYNSQFRGGLNIASCDIDKDGLSEIITGPGAGGGPHVKIFTRKGELKSQFFAYNKNFNGGVNLACGDVDGDGENEIITGAGTGGGPQIRIFSAKGKVEGQFFAYSEKFRGGAKVALGDIEGGARNRKMEIITAPGAGGGPHIIIFDNRGAIVSQFFAYNPNFKGGVSVASGDIDNDGLSEIITGAGPGGTPHARIFKINKNIIGSFYAYPESFSGGVNVGAIEMK
jgi:subtilisin family serine protease